MGAWSLSPAYDLSFNYNTENQWLKSHQMNLNGKTRDFTKRDLDDFAKNIGINKVRANDMIEQVHKVFSSWDGYATTAGVGDLFHRTVEKRAPDITEYLIFTDSYHGVAS